jgi:hypothetical protein
MVNSPNKEIVKMQLSPTAQQIRELADRLTAINSEVAERVEPDTGEPEHEIDSSELNRLKIALKPLVSDELQSRFVQVLNKMRSGSPITTSEARLITVAFMSMADIIAGDNALISRLRKDITDFNTSHDDQDLAADVNPNLEIK